MSHQSREDLKSVYRFCFSTPYGKQVLEDLDTLYGGVIPPNESPSVIAYRAGQQSVILDILSMIESPKGGDDE